MIRAGLHGALALAAWLALAAAAPPRLEGDTAMSAAEARPALERALAWLVANQREDGSWSAGVLDRLYDMGFSIESYYSYKVASDSLACLALLRADETPERRAALERGVEWLCTTRPPKRGSDWDNDCVWGGLYAFVVCVEVAGDPRFSASPWAERVAAAGLRFLDLLERNQTPLGGWAYYDDPIYSRRPKWATSFCTALVLPALQRSIELGWLTDAEVLARAQRYVARCAQPNGAFSYDLNPLPGYDGGEHIDDVKGSLGRIQVCNCGLARVGEKKITVDRVREGLASFLEHHRFLDTAFMRPIPHEAYYANAGYFYLFGHFYAAEAIGLLPAAERESWHARLRPHVIKVQRADGSTSDFLTSGYMVVAGTAYLALTLQRGMPVPE